MTSVSQSSRLQDAVAGLSLALLGALAIYFAQSYRGGSGMYPEGLGVALVILGLLLAVRAIRMTDDGERRSLASFPPQLFATLAITVAYLAIIPELGFYTSSTIVLLVLPVVLGFRRPTAILACTVVSMVIIYSVFALVVKRPLPTEFFLD